MKVRAGFLPGFYCRLIIVRVKSDLMLNESTYTAFAGSALLASGTLETMLPRVKALLDRDPGAPVLIFDDQSGKQTDFDFSGPLDEVLARAVPAQRRAGPGRPKLGVYSREISLLPRHWEWLEQQSGGASATLRRLVEEARKRDPSQQRARVSMDAAYRFMSAMAGNLAGFEEAARALYAANHDRFRDLICDWPEDIRAYAERLAADAFQENTGSL
jgi:hypothetical protein